MRTVPQIFIHDRHVGGYNELAALDRDNQLEAWLANDPAAWPADTLRDLSEQ
jgi:glutaredoxin 3